MARQQRLVLGGLCLLSCALLLQNEVHLRGKHLLSSLQPWNEPLNINFALQPSSKSLGATTSTADWFRDDLWHENNATKECWHVENMCHSSHRWFYDTRAPNNGRRQPPFSLDLYGQKMAQDMANSSATIRGRPRILIVRAPASRPADNDENDDMDLITPSFLQTCTYSPIPNHIVLQSHFNGMLGEFYARGLTHLSYIQQSITRALQSASTLASNDDGTDSTSPLLSSNRPTDARSRFLEQTQIYLHVRSFTEHSKLLDSHHLFTDAFRSNPLLSFTNLLDNTGCRCLKRLFLCGYKVTNGKQVGQTRGVFSKSSVPTELEPAPKNLELNKNDPFQLRELRRELLHVVLDNNPLLQRDIASFRADAIARHRPALANKLTPEEVGGFRIVGLTQRKGRRKWLNLEDIIWLCNNEWFGDDDKIVCVEICIESNDVNPVRQVVIHAACNMLIGIHGAQLTEAIWMRDGSVVVELLPWIPDNAKYGSWTRRTHIPTPLGAIFSECPLNHIGYRLERASAPYCFNKTEPIQLKRCFRGLLWDNRDFQMEAGPLRDMIQKFVPRQGSQVAVPSCQELRRKAGKRVYVLYNVYCRNDTRPNDAPSVHHFYWPKVKNKTK